MADSINLQRNIRKAIQDSAPVGVTPTEVGDIFEAVMGAIRADDAVKKDRLTQKYNNIGVQSSDQWTDERYS